jgi:hypothetical protein
MAKLLHFKGKQIIDCADQIEAIAERLGYAVNVMDPAFNGPSIDEEPNRLNVRTDKNSIITSFTIG